VELLSEKNNQSEPMLSVIIPVYNEEKTVALLVEQVLAVPFDMEIVLVNDCSKDRTAEILADLAKKDARLKVINHEVNRGKGAAIHTAIPLCRGRFVLIQDADLEYNPEEYVDLLEPLVNGKADVVFGSRFITQRAHRVMYYWHSVLNNSLTMLTNMLADINLTDMETCYKVFRREVIQSLKLYEERFGFEPEVTINVARMGCRIYEVGISYAGRTYEEGKKIQAKDGFRAIYCILKYGLTAQPQKCPPAREYSEDELHLAKLLSRS
jgi:glycosyltransferase involved in cell wall biosynthesis